MKALSGPVRIGGELRALTTLEKGLLAMIALGSLMFVAALFLPGKLPAVWAGPLIFGLIVVGAVGLIHSAYSGTRPGIKNNGIFHSETQNLGWLAWLVGAGLTGFYVVLYWSGGLLRGGAQLLDPLSHALRGAPADHWFMYGFFYTLAVLVMGYRMIMKYRHSRYQIVRTLSLSSIQLVFAFVLPHLLRKFANREFYFTYFWPLDYKKGWPSAFMFNPAGDNFAMFLAFWGVFAILVLTPVLTYFFGKRWYCSWVCGCGALAETMGDPWRQLSNKSDTAWRIERRLIYSILVFLVLLTAGLWVHDWVSDSGKVTTALTGTTDNLKQVYGFFIGMIFSGVVGVGFYPLMGSRVWCRFGCPMAAVLGILQRKFSRFRITTNGGLCISCGNCSTYCEMGIDVRSYAQKGEDIVRSSCVGCGICSEVCPRGVLKLENGSASLRSFE